jgi:acid phosphatase class B
VETPHFEVIIMKFILSVGLGGLLASGALAINFGSTATVDGNTYTINGGSGANGISVQQIGNSLSFALPNGVAINANKTLTLEYFVAATPGNFLAAVNQIAGNGTATGASSVSLATAFTGAINETAPTINYGAGSTFSPVSYSFTSSPVQWNKVTTTIALTGSQGLAKVSTYSANYSETPVPEPVTTIALASGVVGLIARRRKK